MRTVSDVVQKKSEVDEHVITWKGIPIKKHENSVWLSQQAVLENYQYPFFNLLTWQPNIFLNNKISYFKFEHQV